MADEQKPAAAPVVPLRPTASAAPPAKAPLPALKLWCLMARDLNEPPFHYVGVAHTVFVAAPDEERARALAFIECACDAWGNSEKTRCFEFKPNVPAVVVAVSG